MNADTTPRIRIPSTRDSDRKANVSGDRTVSLNVTSSDAFPPQSDRQPENLFTQYTIIDKIGDGGMGVVYLAKDRRLERYVAIKRLNHKARDNTSLRRRFLQEARAVAALNHIHIVHIYALGEDVDGPYIVMEYVPGPDDATEAVRQGVDIPNDPYTLDRRVSRKGQLSVSEACELLIKIGRAISYAHSSGVIHRDMKPSNVLLDRSNEPKIVDFGLARLMREEEDKLTVTGEKLLSLGYGAPEQETDAGKSDERADVYGLGALFFFAITGQNPRYYRDQDVPETLREVIGKALATNRERRWPTASAFTDALIEVHTRTRVEQPTVKTTWRCKWCDTVNPLTIRYCAECGWDGGETCPECGNDTFVGIQYCGTCGADARAYEALAHVLHQMRRGKERRQFERIVTLAARAPGIEPSGPAGREMLASVQELKEEAERNQSRRNHLLQQIPIEIRAENYERALDFIEECETLSEDRSYFKKEKHEIPDLLIRRDVRRADSALRSGRWKKAERICSQLQSRVGNDNPACHALIQKIKRHFWWRRSCTGILSALLLFMLYLASFVPMVRFFPGMFRGDFARSVFTPALWLQTAPYLSRVFVYYNRLWNMSNPAAILDAQGLPDDPLLPQRAELPELAKLRQAYSGEKAKIIKTSSRMEEAWPQEYLQALDSLMERRRMAGDFEGWERVGKEHRRFSEKGEISEPLPQEYPELQELKKRHLAIKRGYRLDQFRRLIALNKKYINDLTDLQRTYTKAGNMEAASIVNEAIHGSRSAPELIEAEEELAAMESSPVDELTKIIAVSESEQTAELEKIRARFAKALEAVEQSRDAYLEQWPEQYVADLQHLMEAFRAQGSFEGWESVSGEIERFELERELEESDIASAPAELARLQKHQLELLHTAEKERARKILEIRNDFVGRLRDRLTALTKAGNMTAAALVNAEIRRVSSDSRVIHAQAVLDEAASNVPDIPSQSTSP